MAGGRGFGNFLSLCLISPPLAAYCFKSCDVHLFLLVWAGMQQKTPPPGYVCHRCKVPGMYLKNASIFLCKIVGSNTNVLRILAFPCSGHFIQHCPTNGDPNFDLKRVKPPTGIPRSMLMAAADGSYALPTGDVAVLKPNE